MEIFKVGGAVRDRALGLTPHDEDFVVVGASPAEMLRNGFRQVGNDFAVYLHPETGCEYAIAREERTGHFDAQSDPERVSTVSLVEDLSRRDLTINAMAQYLESGLIVDPFDGMTDLVHQVLRHVGPSFAEDPIRVLRVARFAARFPTFTVAPETMQLMANLVQEGAVDNLVPERVFQELVKGLSGAKPSRMFDVLRECGALAVIFPELDALAGIEQPREHHPESCCLLHTVMAVDYAAEQGFSTEVRFAVLCHDLGKATTPKMMLPSHPGHEAAGVEIVKGLCKRLKVPAKFASLAHKVCKFHTHSHRAMNLTATRMAKLFRELDAYRNPGEFEEFIQACVSDSGGRAFAEPQPYPQADYLRALQQMGKSLNRGAVVAGLRNKRNIPGAIHAAEVSVLKQGMSTLLGH